MPSLSLDLATTLLGDDQSPPLAGAGGEAVSFRLETDFS